MGEIRPYHLEELEPSFVKVASTVTIGEIRPRLAEGVRWVVVEFQDPEGTTWSIADAYAVGHLVEADATPIGLLPQILTPALTLERTAQGFGEARWRAWRSRDRVLVVVENGAFAGLVGDPDHSLTRGEDAAQDEARFLRAKVEAPGAEPELRTESFAPGRPHTLTVSVGPHQAGLLTAETAVPPEQISAELLKVTVVAPWTTAEGQLFVPERGASSDCVLDLGVPPEGIVRLTIMVFSKTSLVQTATLIGETTDAAPEAPLALLIDASLWPRHGGPMPTLVADTDRVVAAVPTDDGFDLSGSGDLEEASKSLFEDLEMDLQGLWLDKHDLDDAETVDVLRKIARAGVALRDDLFERLPPDLRDAFGGTGPIQLVVRDPKLDVPLELFYDAPTPHLTDSVLCPGARESLRAGSCKSCGDGGSTGFICPMGFWGLRRVIERRVLQPDRSGAAPLRLAAPTTGGRPILTPLDSALVAKSERVEGGLDELKAALKQAPLRVLVADNWVEWSQAVSGQNPPPVLIAMPHVDQTGGESRMEIGDQTLERVDISPQYVCFPPRTDDRPGPVVLLLGCQTADAALAHRTMTSRFLASGASVVLGTRMPVIAAAAEHVGAAIIRSVFATHTNGAHEKKTAHSHEIDADGVPLGEAIRAARCQLVAEGNLVALALVALGDGGWLLPTRKSA